MKKHFVFKTFLASLFVAFTLASCNQISDSALVSTSKNNVKVSLAIPSEIENALGFENDLENNFSARSALPNVASVKYELKLTATGKTPKTLTSDTKSFEFDLENGNWTFTVSVFEKTAYETDPSTAIPFLKGEKTVTVGLSVLESVEIALSLNKSQNGSLDLGVYWTATEISKCNYKIGPSISGTLSTGGKITKTDVAPGFYDAELLFFNSSDELLYSIHSVVGVFAGLTTTKWLGETEYDSAAGGINITDTMVESFPKSIFFVNTSNTGNESGSYYEPFKTIQKAIDKAIRINDKTSTYKIYLANDADFIADAGKPVMDFSSLSSSTDALKIDIIPLSGTSTLKGNGASVIVADGSALELNLKNLKITGGTASVNGGGIDIEKGKLTITSCEITGNSAPKAGGIYLNSGLSLTIKDTKITNNTSSSTDSGGGGLYTSGVAELIDCTVTENKFSNKGGGLYADSNGTIILSGSTTISGNEFVAPPLPDTGENSGTGIYCNGILKMGGDVKIDRDTNDVYLGKLAASSETNYIILTDSPSFTTKITPKPYTEGVIVVKDDDGKSFISSCYDKFEVTDEITVDSTNPFAPVYETKKWYIGIDGKLTMTKPVQKTSWSPIYLDPSSGADTNKGSELSSPVKTLEKAIENLDFADSSPTIVILSPYTLAAGETDLLDFSDTTKYPNSPTIKRYFNTSSDYCAGDLITMSIPDVVAKRVTIDGNWKNGSGTVQIEDCGGPLLSLNNSDITISENVTLKNNSNKTGNGGAIYCKSSAVTFNGKITGNNAVNGGALYLDDSTLTLTGGEISENTATLGNAIWGDHLEIELSGTLKLGADADVYFEDDCNITIKDASFNFKDASTSTDKTLKISLKEYKNGEKVFYGDIGIAITDAICEKFVLGNADYKLVPANLSGGIYTEGIIKSTETVAVANASEFETFIDRVNAGENYISIKLDSDIDLSSASESFVIGQTESNPYNGTFDGQGHTVTVSLNSMEFKRSSAADFDYAGIVGILGEKGVIENVTIKSNETLTIDVDNQNGFVSGICLFNNGVIRNCVNNASIWKKTFWDVGGICAVNKGLIENCLNTGDITIKWSRPSEWAGVYARLGGITAVNNEDSSVIKNCANLGKIATEYAYETSANINGCPGAIAGLFNNANSKIENCYWLENCVTKGTTTNSNVAWNGTFKSLKGSVTECGTFTAITSITSGTAADCGSEQTLAPYASGKGLVDAMNGWIGAQSEPSIYRRWTADDFTKPHVSSGITIEIDGTGGYAFELSSIAPKFGDTITLTVKKSGSAVTAVSTTMQLIQGGDFENPVSTSTTGSLTIPAWLSVAGTNFKLYITATIGGTTYDKIVDITVSQ